MSIFAVRRAVRREVATVADKDRPLPEGVADAAGVVTGLCWLRSYWTPEDGLLFSLHESSIAGDAPAIAAASDAVPVIELNPEQYIPLVESPPALNVYDRPNEEDLPLVLARRTVEPASETEFHSMALRAVMCALEYRDLVWLRSYWAPEQQEITCIFRAASHDLVREHAARSRLPLDEVYDAIEIRPETRQE